MNNPLTTASIILADRALNGAEFTTAKNLVALDLRSFLETLPLDEAEAYLAVVAAGGFREIASESIARHANGFEFAGSKLLGAGKLGDLLRTLAPLLISEVKSAWIKAGSPRA